MNKEQQLGNHMIPHGNNKWTNQRESVTSCDLLPQRVGHLQNSQCCWYQNDSKCIKLADRSEELKFLLPDIRRANSSGQSDKASNAQKHATASLVAASDSYQSFKGQSNMLQCNPIHGVSLMALGIVTDCLAASCCCECCCQSGKVPNVGAHCLIPVVSSSWSNASCMLLVLTP